MKICPKCRSFYEYNASDFCLNDGIPLVAVSKSAKIWNEGSNFLRARSKEIAKRKKISTAKKILSYFVTTLVCSSLFFVIIANTVIYLDPNSDEVATDDVPEDQSDVGEETVEIPEALTETPGDLPVSELPEQPIGKPRMEPAETPKIPSPITTTLTPTKTPTGTPTETPSPTPCIIQKEMAEILNLNSKLWSSRIERQRLAIKQEYARRQLDIPVKADHSAVVSIGQECKNAGVTVNFKFTSPKAPDPAIQKRIVEKTGSFKYSCKKFGKWQCQAI